MTGAVPRLVPVGLLIVLATVVACASANSTPGGPIERPATDAPAQFVTQGGTPPSAADAGALPGCRNPLFDPRDNTRIVLDRSARGIGDYLVPGNRYGVGDGELLRVDCATGRPMGIVRR